MKNRLFMSSHLLAIMLAAISVGVLAQQQSSIPITPNSERLRQYVTYLASDALEGRRTGSPGANDAANYIAGEFSRLGLRPAVPKSGTPRKLSEIMSPYLQTFPYVAGVDLGKENQISFLRQSGFQGVQSLRLAEEWMPLGFSSNSKGFLQAINIRKFGQKLCEHLHARGSTPFGRATDGINLPNNYPHWPTSCRFPRGWIFARTTGAEGKIQIATHDQNVVRASTGKTTSDHRRENRAAPGMPLRLVCGGADESLQPPSRNGFPGLALGRDPS